MSLATFEPGEVDRFTRDFEELFYAADPAAMTSYYTENAQLMADGMAPIQGHGAIELFWRTAIDRGVAAGARRTIALHESSCSGDLGYALCTVTVEIPARAEAGPDGAASTDGIASGGASATGGGASDNGAASGSAGGGGFRRAVWDATIWHRDPSGRWRIAVDISTPLPPG